MFYFVQIHLLLLATQTGENSARVDIWVCAYLLHTYGQDRKELKPRLIIHSCGINRPAGQDGVLVGWFFIDVIKIGGNGWCALHEFGVLLAMNNRPLSGDYQPG